MTDADIPALIDRLAADARPVRPLRPPLVRAAVALGLIAFFAALAVIVLADADSVRQRLSGRDPALVLEMAAMLATALIAVAGAFALSVPGGSKRWLVAPLPPALLWLSVSGAGCYADLVRRGGISWRPGEGSDCLLFIVAVSALVAPLLVWRLARARPIEPLPVALLAGLGVAAASALVLVFFHPFAVTAPDLAMHFAGIALVVGTVALLNRRALAPA